jgi:hypothetical protein
MPQYIKDDDLDFGMLPKPSTTTTAVIAAAAPPIALPYEQIDWDEVQAVSYSDGLDRLKTQAGEVIRFAIIPGIPLVSGYVHWILQGQTKRMYRCNGLASNGWACTTCQSNEKKRLSLGMAVQYVNANKNTGALPADTVPDYRVGYVSLSQPNLNDIVSGPLEGVRPTQVDYVMTFDKRRYGFRVVANQARHIQRQETAGLVALARPLVHLLGKKLGSPLPVANGENGGNVTTGSLFEDF